MNARTSKLLRKWTNAMGSETARPAKNLWRRTPRTKRPQLRKNIKNQLREAEEAKTATT